MAREVALSVIVPVYNAEGYLERCLSSAVRTDSDDIEIILVDDGSTDRSYEIAQEFAAGDRRIRVLRQKNSGVSAARNRGIQEAEGRYLMFLDADDYLCDGYFDEILGQLDSGIDFVGWANFTNLGTAQTLDFFPLEQEATCSLDEVKRILMSTSMLHTCWGKIHRRDIIAGNSIRFPENEKIGEDYLFELEYFRCVRSASLINRPILHYLVHENSAMTTFDADMRIRSWRYIYSFCRDYIHAEGIDCRADFNVYQLKCLTSLLCDLCAYEVSQNERLSFLQVILDLDEVQKLLSEVDGGLLGSMKRFELGLMRSRQPVLILSYFSLKAKLRKDF